MHKNKITDLEKEIAGADKATKVVATTNDVAESVERLTGIPVSKWVPPISNV